MRDNLLDMWLGTETSLSKFVMDEFSILKMPTEERMRLAVEVSGNSLGVILEDAKLQDTDSGYQGEFGDGQFDHMLTREGNLAVVRVDGELTTKSSWVNQYLGRVSYGEIRGAVTAAAEDPDIEGIVLDMATPGGQASGIMELSDFLGQVDKKHTPIYTYSGTSMCSGGYWLGCVGREIYASKMASVGSIGVLMVHQSYKRMMEEHGIDTTVVRSGEFKALGNPYEKLTPKAQDKLQSECDKLYGIFLDHVGEQRGMSVKSFQQKAAEGQVFLAMDAVDLGLVDKITFYDEALQDISKKASKIARRKKSSGQSNTGVDDMTTQRRLLSEQEQAALASGAAAEQVLDDAEQTVQEPEQGAEVTTDETAQEAEPGTEGAQVSEEAEEKVKPEAGSDMMVLVQKISDLTAQVTKLEMEKSTLDQKLQTVSVTEESLMKIATSALSRMEVAMGRAPSNMEGQEASSVVSAYQASEKAFFERFPVGGKSKVAASTNLGTVKRDADFGVNPSLASQSGMTL